MDATCSRSDARRLVFLPAAFLSVCFVMVYYYQSSYAYEASFYSVTFPFFGTVLTSFSLGQGFSMDTESLLLASAPARVVE